MTLQEYKDKRMQDPAFTQVYEEMQPQMNEIRTIIDRRTSPPLEQKELSELNGIAEKGLMPAAKEVPVAGCAQTQATSKSASPYQDRLNIVDALYGSVPALMSLEEAQKERLDRI